jgi:hypothetical protein
MFVLTSEHLKVSITVNDMSEIAADAGLLEKVVFQKHKKK